MKKKRVKQQLLGGLLALTLLALASPSYGEVKATYLYNLSNFTGTLRHDWAKMHADTAHKEFYVAYGDTIRVFNDVGMELYRFGTYDADAATVADIATDEDGNILFLSYSMESSRYYVSVCNFRGEPKSKIEFKNIPPEFSDFFPTRMIYRDGKLYLVSSARLKVVVTDLDGNFKEGIDLAPLIEVEDKKRSENDINGFFIDRDGNMLFTVGSIGKAYVMAPDRTIAGFGRRGSGPGKFGVPAGIVRDSAGNFFVADILRAVVLIFDKDMKFVSEFGYRGMRPGNLIGPRDLVIDGADRIYVDQMRKRGVSVFKIENN